MIGHHGRNACSFISLRCGMSLPIATERVSLVDTGDLAYLRRKNEFVIISIGLDFSLKNTIG